MRTLITNDDGVESPGLAALANVARELGLDTVVAAPDWNSSGAAASLTGVTAEGRLLFSRISWPTLADVAIHAVQATPAMIVRVAAHGAFGPAPELVLSGINDGPNTGHAILHSGTVGAALTAATHGLKAIAFSLGTAQVRDYTAAVHVAREVIRWTIDQSEIHTLNVNVPSGPPERLRGLRVAPLATVGAVQTTVTELDAQSVRVHYEEVDPETEPNTDAALLAAGYATVTSLRPACEAEPPSDWSLPDLGRPTRSRSEARSATRDAPPRADRQAGFRPASSASSSHFQ